MLNEHTGKAVADRIITTLDSYGITSKQSVWGSYDGQYFTLNVPKYLNSHYDINAENVHNIHDPLHRAGLVDTHLRKESKFNWVNTIT